LRSEYTLPSNSLHNPNGVRLLAVFFLDLLATYLIFWVAIAAFYGARRM
jgi:hypothetical protein